MGFCRQGFTQLAALAAALLAAVAVLAPGAARAAVSGASPPALAVDPANQDQVVFWRAGNGDIWESSEQQGQWQAPIDLTSRYGLGPASIQPAAAVAADGEQYLVWRGLDGRLHGAQHTSTGWSTQSFSARGRATSAPAIGVDPRSKHQYVYWRGTDGYIHEAWYTGRWHCCSDFRGWGPAASALSVAVADDEQQYVFWRMPNGHIREAHHTSRWMPIGTFTWRTTAAPAVGVDPVNHHQDVFWRDRAGQVVEAWYPRGPRGGWAHPRAMSGWPRITGSPSAAVADDGQQYVFWETPGSYLAEALHTRGWSTSTFPSWTSASSGLSLTSLRFSGTYYAAGCEMASRCVLAGFTQAQGLPARLVVEQAGKVVRSAGVPHSSAGNDTGISCPSTRACVAVVPTDGTAWGTVLSTIDASGHIASRVVSAPTGVEFNAISCTSLTACELAGTNNGAGGEIAVASWNGHSLGKVILTGPPASSGQSFGLGNDLPTISCAGSHCEVGENLEVFGGSSSEEYEGLLIGLTRGSVTASNLTPGYTIDSLSCGAAGSCWSILTPTSGSAANVLAPISDDQPGPAQPLDLPAQSIACQGSTCILAGGDEIETLANGVQQQPEVVSGARSLNQVSASPGGLFPVLGSASPSGSILVLAQP